MSKKTYQRPKTLFPTGNSFCPGCNHGTVAKLIAEVLDEMDLASRAICVLPIGCGGLNNATLDVDMVSSPHGRASAVAAGVKRTSSESIVFAYQGDGDLASIGTCETIHTANRGEPITTIFVNNGIFGMTGGQMAPTTLVGEKTTTTPLGRDPKYYGYPLKMCELMSQLNAVKYVARFACDSPQHILQARAGIKRAFETQLQDGYAFVEILSACPTSWGLSPLDSLAKIREKFVEEYPLGEFKNERGE